MIDALTSLAFAVQSGKGVYALLLGSGLSTGAGIPTGWAITLDLVRKVAASEGKDCGADPAAWYKSTHGQDADYSNLLDRLANTPADRTNLLSQYFEPTAGDVQQGWKSPTPAHKSIAALVAKGYFRVLVTTNFDRLLERALEDCGVSPTVISSADAVHGALPLAHAHCTVVKVNGDYRDTRIKNTVAELDAYDLETDRLLDRIFDEYGLLVCGWSATWDKALCRAMLRCPNRRFAVYWARRKGLSDEARALINHRRGVQIEIDSADVFFTALDEKVDAIERYSEPHPESSKIAVASLKKYIVEDRYRIQLHDLLMSEAEALISKLSLLPLSVAGLTVQQIFERMKLYESTTETLLALLCHGSAWGEQQHEKLWCATIGRIAQLNAPSTAGMVTLISLRLYPACLLFYASGISAIATGKYELLTALCRHANIRSAKNEQKSLVSSVLPWSVLDNQVAAQLPGYQNRYTPISDRLAEVLRDELRDYLADDLDYQEAFDRFEYLTALVALDIRISEEHFGHAPVGRFGWRRRLHFDIVDRVSQEVESAGDQWPVIKSKLFSSVQKFRELEGIYRENMLRNLTWF